MKYLRIDGFSVNEEKNINIVWGQKLKNDFKNSHGKEVDTVIFSRNLVAINDSHLGKSLNVEWNKGGYIVNASVE